MSVSVPILIGITVVAVAGVSLSALGLLHRMRIRRHLHRLRRVPLEQGSE